MSYIAFIYLFLFIIFIYLLFVFIYRLQVLTPQSSRQVRESRT